MRGQGKASRRTPPPASASRILDAVPLVGTGYSYLQDYLPHVAQAVVREGWADFVGLGRMVLSYPELPADTLAGRPAAAQAHLPHVQRLHDRAAQRPGLRLLPARPVLQVAARARRADRDQATLAVVTNHADWALARQLVDVTMPQSAVFVASNCRWHAICTDFRRVDRKFLGQSSSLGNAQSFREAKMLKRIMLTLTFVAAFSAAGAGLTNTAEAWRGWGRPYRAYYAPAHITATTRRTVPTIARITRRRVYRPYYTNYYAYPDYYYYGPPAGVSVSFGF